MQCMWVCLYVIAAINETMCLQSGRQAGSQSTVGVATTGKSFERIISHVRTGSLFLVVCLGVSLVLCLPQF